MSFLFVVQDGRQPSHDPTMRTLIRKHAMRDVAADRRRRGNYGKHNLVQFPVFVVQEKYPDKTLLDKEAAAGSQTETGLALQPRNQARSQLRAGRAVAGGACFLAEIPRSPCANQSLPSGLFALLKYLPLAGLRLGLTPAISQTHPPNVEELLTPQLGARKLLSFIPCRYREVEAIRLVIDCLVAKLRRMIRGDRCPKDEMRILVLHTKAIRAVSSALEKEGTCFLPETLCATELLAAYEVGAQVLSSLAA
jgi:hypothetical protein